MPIHNIFHLKIKVYQDREKQVVAAVSRNLFFGVSLTELKSTWSFYDCRLKKTFFAGSFVEM